ncbi:unnamed protein product [Allacma fusca]|uniref:Uncharacterized protein n=1 Tax=Allacma fusca TaxID=39272 RepID=A0A8J2KEG9_9HEXA|nr:unnamed protein product [Allacma fusca]
MLEKILCTWLEDSSRFRNGLINDLWTDKARALVQNVLAPASVESLVQEIINFYEDSDETSGNVTNCIVKKLNNFGLPIDKISAKLPDLLCGDKLLLKHVSTRILSLLPALDRILGNWDALAKYFHSYEKGSNWRVFCLICLVG